MGRTKGSKNKVKAEKPTAEHKFDKPQILEASITLAADEAPKQLDGWNLYKALSDAGFPQGGVGNWMSNEDGTQKVYIPHPSEVYNQFIANPSEWETMGAAMCRVWLENKK